MSTDKLDMKSPDLVNESIEKIAELFPNCVTEGAEGKSIDFDMLKQELGHTLIEGNKERYRLEWPGKKEAIVTANLPITKTLRPVREDSVDFENTENIYIEGDNLEVLKLLQESYLGKIKMIYIDPPYNTGNDFVYKDNFFKDVQDELLESGQKDEYNQKLVVNPETAGRYHSDWLSMIYPRLKLARNLLTNDGVIFISIDDNEVHNLRKVCDEVFGEGNFIDAIVWKKTENIKMDSRFLSRNKDYVLSYRKNSLMSEFQKEQSDVNRFNLEDDRGKYYFRKLDSKSAAYRPTLDYVIENEGKKYYPGGSEEAWEQRQAGNVGQFGPRWLWSKNKFEQGLLDGDVIFKDGKVYNKVRYDGFAKKPFTDMPQLPSGQTAQKELNELLERRLFDYPKSPELIKWLMNLVSDATNFIVLDFFSGSASTAHAVMQLNSEDGGNRKFILAQIPEAADEKSEAFKAGYKNICEIGKERIRRAAIKIEEETNAKIDYGFRVYRLDESNMQDVYYKPQDYTQSSLDLFADNVKSDRTSDDLLAQVMLDWGLALSLKIETKNIRGKNVFKVAENSLFACFDKGIDEDFAKELAAEKPLRVVFKDNAFKDDTAKTNVKQLLKQLSPTTEMKVI